MSDFLSEEEDHLSGAFKPLDEKDFFLILCFCILHSLATSGMVLLLVLQVFAYVQYDLTSNNWDKSDEVFGKKNVRPRRLFSLSMTSDFSSRFLEIHFATGRQIERTLPYGWRMRPRTSMVVSHALCRNQTLRLVQFSVSSPSERVPRCGDTRTLSRR